MAGNEYLSHAGTHFSARQIAREGHEPQAVELANMPLALANLAIDVDSPLTIYEQICLALRTAIANGELPPGMTLPTAATMAQFLGVARNTVVTAYGRLAAEGYLSSNRRRGTRVAVHPPCEGALERATQQAVALAPLPNVITIGFYARAALSKKVIRSSDGSPFCLPVIDSSLYPRTKLGRRIADEYIAAPKTERSLRTNSPERNHFRQSVAYYVRQARGITCALEQVLPVSSLETALDLTGRLLIDPGHTVRVPEIVSDFALASFSARGARVDPMPCDAAGPRPDALAAAPPARLIFVPSSVRFPFGTQVSEPRRHEIVAAAYAQNAIIFENDCGHQLLYDGTNLRSIYALDGHSSTIYYGSLSEVLGMGTGLGFLIVPPSLVDAFHDMAQRLKNAPSPQICDAVARMMDEQEFAVHLRDVRAVYARHLRQLRECAQKYFPGYAISEPHGGLHMVIYLTDRNDETRLCAAAVEAGLPVAPLSHYCAGANIRRGIVLSFGMLSERMIDSRMRQLSEIMGQHSRQLVVA